VIALRFGSRALLLAASRIAEAGGPGKSAAPRVRRRADAIRRKIATDCRKWRSLKVCLVAREERVKIENPVYAGNDSTSLKRAQRFVRSGRAVFTGPSTIRFLDSSQQQRIRLQADAAHHAKLTGTGYDSVDRLLTQQEAAHLPIIRASRMMREETSSRDWSYKAGVSRHLRPDHTAQEVEAIRLRSP
jgi:hypothetical protein